MRKEQREAIEGALQNPAGETGGAVEFSPGNSLLHRLHPATKVVLTIGIIFTVFLLSNFQGPLVVLILLLIVLIVFGFVRTVGRISFLLSLPFGISLLVVHGLFNPANQTPLFILEPIPIISELIIWEEGIRFGLLFYFRLISIIIATLTLIRTTHPRRLSIGLENKGVPSKLTYVFMSALQLAPQVKRQAQSIVDAQQARGLDTETNLIERAKSLVAMVIPLFISILITTQTRALALESRGFSRKGERTPLLEVHDTRLDVLLRGCTLVVVAGVFLWQVFL